MSRATWSVVVAAWVAFALSASPHGPGRAETAWPVGQAGGKARADCYGDPLPEGALARLGTIRFHHAGALAASAFSPDGKTLVTVGYGRSGATLDFWETATGKSVFRFREKEEADRAPFVILHAPRGVAFSPDGKTVAVCCEQSVRLFEARTGKLLRTFGGQHDLYSFAFSPDGKLLVAGSMEWLENNPIRVWEVATGRELPPFPGRGVSLNALTFSADGQRLFSGPIGTQVHRQGAAGPIPGAVCVWEVASRTKVFDLPHAGTNVAFARDGKTFALEAGAKEIQVVDAATGQERCRVAAAGASFTFSPDGKALATVEADQRPCLWDAATGKELLRCAVPSAGARGRKSASALTSATTTATARRRWSGSRPCAGRM